MSETKISTQNDKELVQCLAFAYFAKFPKYEDESHEENFYSMFNSSSNNDLLNKLKKEFLSFNFPANGLKELYKFESSPDIKLKIIYNLTKKLVRENAIPNLKNYYFLDEGDPFTKLVKDKCLTNIKNAFELPFQSIDPLSSVDVFFVKKNKVLKIQKEFEENFSSKESIINNNLIAGNQYAIITQKYINDHSLYPISLKMPQQLNQVNTTHMRLISFKPSKNTTVEIDPYIKFLSLILEHPEKTTHYISNLVNINFNQFDIGDKQYWKFPIDFNYSRITDIETKQKLENYNLSFELIAHGNGGWNGQWSKKSLQNQNIAGHLGGLSTITFEYYAKKFPNYRTILNSVIKEREKQFLLTVKNYDTKYKNDSEYKRLKTSALNEININSSIPNTTNIQKNLTEFFNYIERNENISFNTLNDIYKLNFINEIRKQLNQRYVLKNQTKYIDKHYEHAQISAFLLKGGKSFELYFKKVFVLAIFGLLTKKSHKVVGIDDYNGMKNIISKEIKVNKRKIIREFQTAPHYIIS